MNTHQDRSRLDPSEKADRAAAAEGLNKGDKRRMQNKLAQRAFRARSKIVNKHVSICSSSSSSSPHSSRLSSVIPRDSLRRTWLTNRRLVDWKIWKNLPNNNPHALGI